MSTPKKAMPPPLLPRATSWTAERVAGLPQLLDVRQLLANAERLGEEELAAICNAEITKRRREALRAPKPAGVKPKPRVKKVVVEDA